VTGDGLAAALLLCGALEGHPLHTVRRAMIRYPQVTKNLPRRDRRPLPPGKVADVDHALAQDLVSRFVGAGAQFAFVGTKVGLGGPPAVVQVIPHHNDHVHVRIANWRR
jgi:hypothetical protein